MSDAAAVTGIARLLSDGRLTGRAVDGDERAFAAIFRRYHQSLYRYCLALVGNPEDAQDALQSTMVKVLRALPGEERKIELKPWLYRIAHNESIDLLRRRRETRGLDVEQVAPGYGLAEDAATRERLRRLLDDLEELPERQRQVLVMRELGGLGFEEIGTALATSGAVARQTLYEARQSLRQMEEGREMSCDLIAKALSDGDGRVTRRRDVRAHLRTCADCRAFREEIKGRERDLAVLSPLPTVVAAGMLQGLLGGSHGAAAGGGLAATLGGGAAKTFGASAAAKGVATAAVVAAIGVTAADRTGVIRVGLPGEQSSPARQSPASPGPVQRGSDAGGVGNRGAAGGDGQAAGSVGSQGSRVQARSAAATHDHRRAPALGGRGHGHHHGQPIVSAHGYGPGAVHPSGNGHAKQHPPASARGQETAAGHQPPPHELSGAANGGGKAGASPKRSTPAASAPGESPKPSSDPAVTATQKQTKLQPSAPEAAIPESSSGSPRGSERPPNVAEG
jgi:RNA polymerase sigma factor (sigma-70 family)